MPGPAQIDATLERLHAKKSAIYGRAWRKRGELLSIFPNIARKYDRLEVAAGEGVLAQSVTTTNHAIEPLLDTVADLSIYALKYLTFLAEQQGVDFPSCFSPSTYADFEGALWQTRLALPRRADALAVDVDLSEIFGKITNTMERIERVLLAPEPEDTQRMKIHAALDLAILSLMMLDLLAALVPTEWAAFVLQVGDR